MMDLQAVIQVNRDITTPDFAKPEVEFPFLMAFNGSATAGFRGTWQPTLTTADVWHYELPNIDLLVICDGTETTSITVDVYYENDIKIFKLMGNYHITMIQEAAIAVANYWERVNAAARAA
jgi:hypothetical protein